MDKYKELWGVRQLEFVKAKQVLERVGRNVYRLLLSFQIDYGPSLAATLRTK